MTNTEDQVKYIMQGMVESGELEYFNDKNGVLGLRKGKNWGKKINKYPNIIAGKKINWVGDKHD